MELSNNLISQFAKLNNNDKTSSGELVYGTTVMQGSKLFVNIDGSDTITPVVTTSDVKPGERVTVMIKDHSATIMGNISNPSAGTEEMGKVLDEYDTIIAKIGNFELVIADKVSTDQLEAKLAIIDNALIGKASIAELNAVKATIKDLDVGKLEADIADINKAIINKADITDLDAVHADIDTLESNVADINTLIGGNLTMDNIQSLVLTTSKVTVDNAFIKDAMIDRVSASKLTAGTINTNLINIGSEDGAMTINGSLQQFKDSDGNVRIQIGKDTNGDFTFVLYGADGQGQIINQNGITSSAISDGLIVDSMVSDNANISGDKLDINSVVTEINNGTKTIKSSKIFLDEKNQTFDMAFNKLSSTVENTSSAVNTIDEKVNSQSTQLSVAQGQIQSLISNTTITKENGQTVSLKDEYSSFQQTVNGIRSKVGSLETTVDNNNKNVTSNMSSLQQTVNGITSEVSSVKKTVSDNKQTVDSQIASFQQTVNGITSEVSSVKKTVSDNKQTVDSQIASFQQSINGFSSEVSSVKSTVNNLQIGGRNYVLQGRGNKKEGFFDDDEWTITDDYAEATLTSTKTYRSISLNNGFAKGVREYEVGDEYTWSYDIMYTNWDVPDKTKIREFWMGQRYTGGTSESSDGAWRSVTKHDLPKVGNDFLNQWIHVEQNIFIPEQAHSSINSDSGILLYYDDPNATATITFRLKNVKLEKGTKATDWTPAPEDVDSAITTVDEKASSINQTVNGIDLEVKKKVNGDSIISAINMSPESIKISSSKVNITGFVTFSDLSTSGSTTIHGGNITTGYMSGDRIRGGIISATEEINFVGGARIFGNTGGLGAGLTISAAGFNFTGGSVNHLSGNWYVTHGGDLTVSDGDLTATNGNVTAGGTITAGSAIYGAGNTALTNSYIWCPYGSSNRDYVRLGGHVIASDSDGTGYLLVLNQSGNYASLRAHAGSFANDVACADLWASNRVYAGGVALTSDESLKTDIRYVGLDPQGISNNGLMTPNVNITTQDMHNFIETLPMVSYRMKQDVSKGVDYTYYGFVAQDILYTKVGSELIENGTITETEEILDKKGKVSEVTTKRDILRYSENKFTAFICGALQEEIKQRKALERRLNDLMDAINK